MSSFSTFMIPTDPNSCMQHVYSTMNLFPLPAILIKASFYSPEILVVRCVVARGKISLSFKQEGPFQRRLVRGKWNWSSQVEYHNCNYKLFQQDREYGLREDIPDLADIIRRYIIMSWSLSDTERVQGTRNFYLILWKFCSSVFLATLRTNIIKN
jgi:hypothetical protein